MSETYKTEPAVPIDFAWPTIDPFDPDEPTRAWLREMEAGER